MTNAPTEFRIWRAGPNVTDKGTHLFTPRSAALLLTDQETRGNLYSIDVDHLSLSPTAPPEARKAVGFHRLEVRPGEGGPELWAVNVTWTPAIRAAIEEGAWKYFSPAYDVDETSGEIIGYLNLGLTNNPATHNLPMLAMRRRPAIAATSSPKRALLDGCRALTPALREALEHPTISIEAARVVVDHVTTKGATKMPIDRSYRGRALEALGGIITAARKPSTMTAARQAAAALSDAEPTSENLEKAIAALRAIRDDQSEAPEVRDRASKGLAAIDDRESMARRMGLRSERASVRVEATEWGRARRGVFEAMTPADARRFLAAKARRDPPPDAA